MNLNQQMGSADPHKTAQACMQIIDRLQNLAPHEQVLGALIVCHKIIAHYRVDHYDAMCVANNIIYGKDGTTVTEFRALDDYIRNELPR